MKKFLLVFAVLFGILAVDLPESEAGLFGGLFGGPRVVVVNNGGFGFGGGFNGGFVGGGFVNRGFGFNGGFVGGGFRGPRFGGNVGFRR